MSLDSCLLSVVYAQKIGQFICHFQSHVSVVFVSIVWFLMARLKNGVNL